MVVSDIGSTNLGGVISGSNSTRQEIWGTILCRSN